MCAKNYGKNDDQNHSQRLDNEPGRRGDQRICGLGDTALEGNEGGVVGARIEKAQNGGVVIPGSNSGRGDIGGNGKPGKGRDRGGDTDIHGEKGRRQAAMDVRRGGWCCQTAEGHVDLYRLQGEQDIESTGLLELLKQKNNIIAIEWPEKMGSLLPEKRWEIRFEHLEENKRKIIINKI